MIRFILAFLLAASVADAQPILTSPTCDITWTRAWVESVAQMRYPKLSFYEVEFATARTGPYSLVALSIVAGVQDGYMAQCPGYVGSGAYWIRLRPVSRGGWQAGRYTPPVMGVLDRGE